MEIDGGLALGGDIEWMDPPDYIPPSWEGIISDNEFGATKASLFSINAEPSGGRWRIHIRSANDAAGAWLDWLAWDVTANAVADQLNAATDPNLFDWTAFGDNPLPFGIQVQSGWSNAIYFAGDVYYVDDVQSELT